MPPSKPRQRHRYLPTKALYGWIVSNPMDTALIVAFLVSKSRNSVGMWLRKLSVPEIVRKEKQDEIQAIKSTLNPDDLLVHVECVALSLIFNDT